jgi:hypothetical protein
MKCYTYKKTEKREFHQKEKLGLTNLAVQKRKVFSQTRKKIPKMEIF